METLQFTEVENRELLPVSPVVGAVVANNFVELCEITLPVSLENGEEVIGGIPCPNLEIITDRKERDAAIDTVALYCQQLLNDRATVSAADSQSEQVFEQAYQWLETALQPIIRKIERYYIPNARFDREDFRQTIRQHLIQNIVPDYAAGKGAFTSFFKGVGWRRLEEMVSKNRSQLSSPTHFSGRNGKKVEINNAGSYQDERWAPQGIDNLAPAGSNAELAMDPAVAYDEKEEADTVARLLTSTLTDKERIAVEECLMKNRPWADVANELGIDIKAIDNALGRAKKKLKNQLLEDGFNAAERTGRRTSALRSRMSA